MIAYFDCFSGISGDMTLGALIDLGVPADWLKENLARIPLDDFDLLVTPTMRSGIEACRVQVAIKGEPPPRDYTAIKTLISMSPLADFTKERSLAIFEKIAAAEAEIHGCPKDHVHFHEVGGVDALVDIIGTVLGVEYLGVERVEASHIPLGSGFVTCQHGTLPVPAPATVAILKDVPVYGTGLENELVTPTGAAIVATLANTFGPLPAMHVKKVGYGAGQTEIATRPNLLRIIIGEPLPATDTLSREQIKVIETSIDDMNPELFGYIMERLFEEGALDVLWIPVYMKKNRPGTLIQVLCPAVVEDAVVQCLLSETTSLGVRTYDAQRHLLKREPAEIETPFGRVAVKRIYNLDGSTRLVPEYEVCRAIALERKLPLRSVYDTILKSICIDNSRARL